jgi:hypothetical protein
MLDEGVLWAPDGRHFAVLSMDSGSVFNVYVFDKDGTWVGEAPGDKAAWVGDHTLIVLPHDPTSQDGLVPAYLASIGYNDVSTMQALPGRYSDIVGNNTGTIALETAQGYALWLNGSLQPAVACGCGPLAISADGSLVAIEDSTGVKVVKAADGQDVRSWPTVGTGASPNASFSPDGQHLALSDVYGSLDTLVSLSVSNGRRADLLAGHFASGGTWSGNAQLLAGDDAGAWWLLAPDGTSARRVGLPSFSSAAVMSSAGSIAAVDDAGSTLLISRSGKTTATALPSRDESLLYWSPDGSEIVVGCESGAVVVARP